MCDNQNPSTRAPIDYISLRITKSYERLRKFLLVVLDFFLLYLSRKKKKYYVRLGDTNNEVEEGTEQDFDIDELIIHQDYKLYPSPRNDIALIKLRRNSDGQCAT